MNPHEDLESEDWKDYFVFNGEALDFKKTFENLGYSENEYTLETVEIEDEIFPVAYAKPRFKNKWVLVDCSKIIHFYNHIVQKGLHESYCIFLSKNFTYNNLFFFLNTYLLEIVFNRWYSKFIYINENNGDIFNFKIKKIQNCLIKDIAINNITIENITCFPKLNLSLGKRATILLGENGTGKTSILRAILLGLIGNFNVIANNDSTKLNFLLTVTPYQKKTNTIFPKLGKIRIELDNSLSEELHLDYNKLQKRIQIYKVIDNSSLDLIYDDIYLEQLILAFPQIQTNTTFGRVSDNVRKIGEEKLPNIHDILGLLYNEPLDILGDLARWIFGLDADSRKEGEHNRNKKNVLDKLFKILSEVIGKKIWFHETDQTDDQIWIGIETPDKPDAPEISLFQLLSQGFKNVFAWVGHIVRRMAESKDYAPDFNKQAAIILIDEIDTYLHPKWQRTILKTLLDNFPNTQFIISTHSPLVANYIPPTTVSSEDMRIYVLEVDSPEPRRLDKVYGQDIKTIFAELGVAERPKPVYNLIHQIFELIDSEIAENIQKANELLNELIDLIGDKDPIIVQIQTAIDLANWGLNSDDSDLNSLNNI